MQLRPYQKEALDDLWNWMTNHGDGNPIVDASVGAGKSLMIAAVCQRAESEYRGTRVVVVVPQKELLQQNAEKLVKVWPTVDLGLVSASIGRKVVGRQVTYSTIGSIWKIAHLLGRIDILMVDECHLISNKDEGMFRSFINDASKYNPHMRVIGWTGTPFRGNGVWLTDGEAPLFNAIAASVKMTRLLEEGYLCPLVPAETSAKIRTDDVGVAGGDYVLKDLAAASDKEELIAAACNEGIELAKDRKRWIVFGVTIDHAIHIRDYMRSRGITAEAVHGNTKLLPAKERDKIIRRYRAGEIRCLVNVAVATTGFDVPDIDCIMLMRATKSQVLYNQIAGRGMRLVGQHISESIANGKADCLWLDFTDTTMNMGPVDKLVGRAMTRGAKADAPFKICPQCGSQNATARLKCSSCGFDFPPPERINHDAKASKAAVLSMQQAQYARHDITGCEYFRHSKAGAPDSMRVHYKAGLQVVATEYVHFDRRGPLRFQAEGWWTRRALYDGIPGTTSDAVVLAQQGVLRVPKAITMTKSKYPEIVDQEF